MLIAVLLLIHILAMWIYTGVQVQAIYLVAAWTWSILLLSMPSLEGYVSFQLKRAEEVPDSATVVCVLTGNGLKDPDCAIQNNDAAFYSDLDPDIKTVAKVMGL